MSEHHHHHHHHIDESEKYKINTLNANRRRKFLSNALFAVMCVLAIIVILTVVWIYMPGA